MSPREINVQFLSHLLPGVSSFPGPEQFSIF
jgi:hypothetical protein